MIVPPFTPTNQASVPDVRVSAPSPVRVPGSGAASNMTDELPANAQPTSAELKSVVSKINLALQQANRNLEFSIDTVANQTVVKLVDKTTGELIRQFPSEATLAISRGIAASQQGLLLQQKA